MVKGGVVVFGLDCGRFSVLTTHITQVDFKAMQLVYKYIQVLRRYCYNSIFNPTPPVNLDTGIFSVYETREVIFTESVV